MNTLKGIVRELTGLFVDDGALALTVVGIVAVAAIITTLLSGPPILAGAVLLLGCPGALFVNVMTAARRCRRGADSAAALPSKIP